MKKKSKRLASLLLVTCMLVALFSFGASAETHTGVTRAASYTTTLNLERRYMEVILTNEHTADLSFTGYANYSLGASEGRVNCNQSARSTTTGKTVNPPNDSLQFYYGTETFRVNNVRVDSITKSLPKL